MARQKFYVIDHGVMRAKWIDPKDIFDVPDKTLPLPVPATMIPKPAEPGPKMVREEPNGPLVAEKGNPINAAKPGPKPEKKEIKTVAKKRGRPKK